jgi:tyrosyl-tRNA synthetase
MTKSEDGIPTTYVTPDMFPMPIWKLFVISGLCKSGSEARRLIEQGGAYICRKEYVSTQDMGE